MQAFSSRSAQPPAGVEPGPELQQGRAGEEKKSPPQLVAGTGDASAYLDRWRSGRTPPLASFLGHGMIGRELRFVKHKHGKDSPRADTIGLAALGRRSLESTSVGLGPLDRCAAATYGSTKLLAVCVPPKPFLHAGSAAVNSIWSPGTRGDPKSTLATAPSQPTKAPKII